MRLAILALALASAASPAHHRRHRHKITWAQECKGFDICDGRLRQGVYDAKFAGTVRLDGAWYGVAFSSGSKFLVNGYWWQITDALVPGFFTAGIPYTIRWESGGYFLSSPDYPGVKVSVKVL